MADSHASTWSAEAHIRLELRAANELMHEEHGRHASRLCGEASYRSEATFGRPVGALLARPSADLGAWRLIEGCMREGTLELLDELDRGPGAGCTARMVVLLERAVPLNAGQLGGDLIPKALAEEQLDLAGILLAAVREIARRWRLRRKLWRWRRLRRLHASLLDLVNLHGLSDCCLDRSVVRSILFHRIVCQRRRRRHDCT